MRKFSPFRSKRHRESSDQTKTTSTTSVSSINIISSSCKVVINDNDQSNEEQIEQLFRSEKKTEPMSGEYEYIDDQPDSRVSTSNNQSSLSTKKTESVMVGNNPKEDILTSCKATAMIYNDAQKKWIHCASNGPAKIQLLFAPDTQTYRIVGRQIQDHEVVLNHSISKGLKYNQATPTFHQWRDQSCVYGLNFSSKLDAQEFGTAMMKILESVNGSTNLSPQTNANGGVTLPSSTPNNNNNNNNNPTSYKRQTNQPSSSSLPPTATTTTVSINSTLTSSPSVSEPQQQQQQHSSSSYNNQQRSNSNLINSTLTSTINNNYNQRHQPAEEDDTNYALISDSYSTYADNLTNKNNPISQVPPSNSSMPTTGSAPPPAPPPPPPPPPPPLPGGFGSGPPPPPPLPNGLGSGPPPAPTLNLSATNGNSGATAVRKTSTTTSAPPMDLMSEMAAKFAQRRKNVDEGDKADSNTTAKGTSKITTSLPSVTAAPVSTSPRVVRKTTESQPTTNYTSTDLEKLKADILNEIRKDIEKAKQEILTAILDHQKSARK